MPDQKIAEKVYSNLLRLYPREFRERFGAEMAQNFSDLSRETEIREEFKWMRVAWLFGDALLHAVRENIVEFRGKGVMKFIKPEPRTALYVAIAMALPMAIIFPVAALNIEPLNGAFTRHMSDTDGHGHLFGILSILAAMISLPLGGAIALLPVFGSMRSREGLLVYRSNLVLGSILLIMGLGLWAGLVLDGLGCSMGTSVCD